ncbi:MAG: hypothetical protein ACR2NM_17780 [Bythopirellula sp.]
MFVLSLICLGCWQEVHYVPSKEVPSKEVSSKKPAASPGEPPAAADYSPTAEVEQSTPELPTPELPTMPVAETLPLDSPANTPLPSTAESDSGKQSPAAVLPPPVEVPTAPVGGESTIATADTPATADTAAPSREPDTSEPLALATWQMASQWSMAVALQAKGRNAESYGERLEQANDGAQLLGVALPELPAHAAGDDRLSDNLTFLLEDAGPQLARDLSEAHGPTHAALAELATKTHVLLLSYMPNSPRLEPVVAAIRRAAQHSGLPEEIWQELVELLNTRAEFNEVKSAVFQLHQRAVAYLTEQGR